MRKIWKWELEIKDDQVITAPLGGLEYLDVQEQDGKLCLWGVVTDWETMGAYTIYIFGTGHPIPNYLDTNTYIGTVVMSNGLVWHVFGGLT